MRGALGAAWLAWLEGSWLAMAMRQWMWLYPIVEIVHIAGFVILIGAAAMFDLRLLGVSRGLSVAELAQHLLPWARASILLVVPTGLMMFTAHAAEMAENSAFRLKLGLIAAAGLNAAIFHRGIYRSVGAWDRDAAAPLAAKVSAGFSLALWASVLACGRLLAYF